MEQVMFELTMEGRRRIYQNDVSFVVNHVIVGWLICRNFENALVTIDKTYIIYIRCEEINDVKQRGKATAIREHKITS